MTTSKGITTHNQGVRLLMSVDLVGSTEYKTRTQTKPEIKEPTPWLNIYRHFFSEFKRRFQESLETHFVKKGMSCPRMNVWRVMGDEILFYSPLYRDPRQRESMYQLCYVFCSIVEELDFEYKKEHELGLKGTIWSAGFPKRNCLLKIDQAYLPNIVDSSLHSDFTEQSSVVDHSLDGDYRAHYVSTSGTPLIDFLGPEIDLGFRLTKHTAPRRTLISLDVAVHLSKAATTDHFITMFHVGWAVLKGVYGGVPYPIIWIDNSQKKISKRRNSYEEFLSDFSKNYLNPSRDCEIKPQDICDLNRDHYDDTKKFRLEEQYLDETEMPEEHRQDTLDRFNRDEVQNDIDR